MSVIFTINGEEHTVSSDVSPSTSLNSYLRNNANLSGTKAMCHEGGCGVCIVSVAALHPVTQEPHFFSVNSCLVTILSCHGWSITTVEGLGNRKDGYHPIQTRLAAFNGTQCGFCSPGWVMSMNSLVEDRQDNLTMVEVENSFAGNICRCTGYRPILDAMKTFASDADEKLTAQINDIEELKMCKKNGLICTKSCGDYSAEKKCCTANMERPIKEMNLGARMIEIPTQDGKWFKVYTLAEIYSIFDSEGTDSYVFVDGNTAQGIYRATVTPRIKIDISNVSELKGYTVAASSVVLGANMTLADTMKVFTQISNTTNFRYAAQLYNHFDLIAHIPVRNIGTLAGNLSIKYQHKEFQSDIFVLFEAIGATLTIGERNGSTFNVSLVEYLDTNMAGRIILRITLPPLPDNSAFYSYKIMPRAQNAHAHVNAAFLLLFNADLRTVSRASIVYGGISSTFSHAVNTQTFIVGKNIFDRTVLTTVLQQLSSEIIPVEAPPEPSALYRKNLSVNLFYKFILHVSPAGTFDNNEISGGDEFVRPVSSGKQDYDTNTTVWPLNQPIPKIEALVQCSGEAKYTNDLPTMPGELYAAFVLSTVCKGTIDTIDPTVALNIEGVVAVFTAKDIPGVNTFTPSEPGDMLTNAMDEEVFASEKVSYYGQPVALLVATSEVLATVSARRVVVTYKDVNLIPPVITVRQALQSPDASDRVEFNRRVEPNSRGTDITKVLNGSFDFYGQYHYHMETQTSVCIPIEDGLDIYCSTQWIDYVQVAVMRALNIPEHKINITVRRLGGAFGGKITRATHCAVAGALAATKLNRPVRFVMPFNSNMAVMGKRLPYATDYELGVNDDGKIQYMENKLYGDDGCNHNNSLAPGALWVLTASTCYNNDTWGLEALSVITDTASNVDCRAPGTTEAVAMTENMMEHIAVVTGKDPVEVRLANIDSETSVIPELIETLKVSAEFDQRRSDIAQFNSENRWRKRGMSLVPIMFNISYYGNFAAVVSIYHVDGTVSVTHGGIEMGQGINTKVAQVCAHILGIPLDMVSVKPTNSFNAPNSLVTGGSITSEVCCFAAMKACQTLLDRLQPIKDGMNNPTWAELVQEAYGAVVDLNAQHMFTAYDDAQEYNVWAVTITEVEVDFLTGNHQIRRVDILEDTGESLSPTVDVGQVEGSLIMGMGYWTTERLVYDQTTGELLTNRSWNYKTLGAKDIPVDMRVSFRRNAPNPTGILRSKATGEPAVNTGISVALAIRQAINAVRADQGIPANEWYTIEMPCTPEHILLAANVSVT